jgi:hypothetical protein
MHPERSDHVDAALVADGPNLANARQSFGWARAISPAMWVSTIAVATTCAAIARLHGFFWRHAGPVGFDDGYTMALAERLIGGKWLPYVDGCSHRGPLLYWSTAWARLLAGPGWKGARVWSVVMTYSSLLATYAIGVSARKPLAGAFAASFLAWSSLVVLAPSPGFALTGEAVASPFVLASLLFASLAIHRVRRQACRTALLGLAGSTAALAGLAKQTALPTIVPVTAWAAAYLWAMPTISLRARRMAALSLVGSFVATIASVLLVYAMHGELRTFFYWFYEYNRRIYMLPQQNTSLVDAFADFMTANPWPVGGMLFATVWSLARPFVTGRFGPRGFIARYAGSGLELTAAFLALSLFASAVAARRFWPHYFLAVLPLVGLVMGLRGEAALSSSSSGARPGGWPSLVVLSAVTAFVWFTSGRVAATLTHASEQGGWPVHDHEPICDTIAASSESAADSLFVWGFAGDIYITCRRKPATRFPYSTLVAGVVPPEWSTPRREFVARNAPSQLVADLAKERPAVILDASESMGNVTLAAAPKVEKYVQREYCAKEPAATLHDGTVKVYVRKDLPACRM